MTFVLALSYIFYITKAAELWNLVSNQQTTHFQEFQPPGWVFYPCLVLLSMLPPSGCPEQLHICLACGALIPDFKKRYSKISSELWKSFPYCSYFIQADISLLLMKLVSDTAAIFSKDKGNERKDE